MKKVLWIGDGYTPTGFARVNHNVIANLPQDKYEVHHLAVNYFGDPHEYSWKMYPAISKGDLLGFNRIKDFADKEFDFIFILNDIWVINRYLELIKKGFSKVPPIVAYFPVDSESLDSGWFDIFEELGVTPVVYTEFGYMQVKLAKETINPRIIPHGVDKETFFKVNDLPKEEVKSILFPKREDFLDSFVILNNNRNQPRKRIDLTVEGFSLFAEGKPENVKLYLHMGLKDQGYDLLRLVRHYDVESRLIITNSEKNNQTVSDAKLNLIYNATDLGINTSTGEGWGLCNVEHASVGIPQIVPDHSACSDLFYDCGLLVPAETKVFMRETMTVHRIVKAEDVADRLERLYSDKNLYNSLSKASEEKFARPEYSWINIAKQWDKLFDEVT